MELGDACGTSKRVNIGIPVYNDLSGLHRTITAMQHQTYKNIKIIVSDNGTKGEIGEQICRMMEEIMAYDSRIIFYKQETNMGAAYNFKFVFEKAKDEYFMWASAGDYWGEKFIEKCIEALEKNRQYVAAFSFFFNEDIVGNTLRSFTLKNFNRKTFLNTFKLLSEHEFLGKANPIYGIFRKKYLLNAMKISPLSEKCFSDVNLVMSICFQGGYVIIPEYLFRKTQPFIKKINYKIDVDSAVKQNIILSKNNIVYTLQLLKSAYYFRALTVTTLSLLFRILRELYFSFQHIHFKILSTCKRYLCQEKHGFR